MADYTDGAYAYLRALSLTYRKHYFPGIADVLQRHGKTTRLMNMKRRVLNGPSMEVEVTTAHNRSTRASLDLMRPMPDPGPGSKVRYTVTFDHTDESNNDFVGLEIGFRTTYFDLKKRADSNYKHASKDPIREDFDEGMADVKEAFARYMHLPTDGKLAQTHASTAKKNNSNDVFASASSYSSGSAAAYVVLADTSIARIGIGQMIEFRSSAGILAAGPFKVNYVHPFENAIVVSVVDKDPDDGGTVDSAGAAVTDCDDITTGQYIYLSGSYNVSPKGNLAAFFDITSTYYGLNRATAANWALQPLRLDVGTTVDLTDDHLRKVGETVAWQMGSSDATAVRAMILARDQYRAIAKFAKDAGLQIVPGAATEVGDSLRRVVGDDGYVLHDPNMGKLAFMVDDFAEYGQIDFLNMSTWEMVDPFSGGFEMIPGPIAGMWTRNTETDGSGRPSKIFSANGIWSFCIINTGAIQNARLLGLNPSL